MQKIDFKRRLKTLYAPPVGRFVAVDVPVMTFLKVDGDGDPNRATAYTEALKWLYGVAYAMKFACKTSLGQDYVVPPLEGLWWADDPAAFVARRKSEWRWCMMIMTPDFVPPEVFDAALAKTQGKLGNPPATLRREAYAEGAALHAMHVGPYDAEGPLLAQLHNQIMPERGLTFNGPHHEIYLSDPRKTAPEKPRTVLRQPVRDLNAP